MVKQAIKLHWWRYSESKHGNFGDEITRLLIAKIYKADVSWAPANECDIIGAGSILAETTENKGANRPFVWGSGLIETGDMRLDAQEFKFCSVRGRLTLDRIDNLENSITLGDPGLLASYLIPKYYMSLFRKRYKVGIIPHYVDSEVATIKQFRKNKDILIIDATQPCLNVLKSVLQCDTILSSSLHGLIVSDSLGIPNAHIKFSDQLKGGEYKFHDYYSAFKEDRYSGALESDDVRDLTTSVIREKILNKYVKPANLDEIKSTIVNAFPFRNKD